MKQFAIVYGKTDHPVLRTARAELSGRLFSVAGEYPTCLFAFSEEDAARFYPIYIGTGESNPTVAEAAAALSQSESYAISVTAERTVIAGHDAAGVLYGVLDLYHKYLLPQMHPISEIDALEVAPPTPNNMPPFSLTSAPATRERGLWTWGHVIYDYRGYLDHMMRLKLNRVIIWNDYPPVNANEIVSYAHERNIKVIWGFAWLWDTNCARFDLAALENTPAEIFAAYERDYADCAGDGIYFQTFTELQTEYIGGRLIAEAATDLVNRTVALFYEKYPELEIQFGLHSESVRNRLSIIEKVDPRVRIVWENCGAFPLAAGAPLELERVEETQDFVRQIAALRGKNDRFGVVTKGIIKLDWNRFTHPAGPQMLGTATKEAIEKRAAFRRPSLRAAVAIWLANADTVQKTLQTLISAKKGDLLIAALVEDGAFEKDVLYPVALEAELLWSPTADLHTLIREVALRDYVTFA